MDVKDVHGFMGVVQPSSEAEDLYVLVFFDDFSLGLKNAAKRWFYEVKNVCVQKSRSYWRNRYFFKFFTVKLF